MKNSKFKIQNLKFKPFFAFCILLSAFSLFAQKTTITGTIENICFEQADLQLLYKDDGVS
jgi:hypothetical protein